MCDKKCKQVLKHANKSIGVGLCQECHDNKNKLKYAEKFLDTGDFKDPDDPFIDIA